MLRSDGNIWCRNKSGTTQTVGTGNTYAINEILLMEIVIQKSGQMDVYNKGQQILTYNGGAATWGTGFKTGEDSFPFIGNVGDRIVYDGAISSADRLAIRTELAEFYGITLT
jgi:hypothetical protein